MDKQRILDLLTALSRNEITADQAYDQLKDLPFKDLDFARIDSHRSLRQGRAEVIYCPGKTAEQIIAIAQALQADHPIIVGTRATTEIAAAIKSCIPEVKYYPEAKMLIWGDPPSVKNDPSIHVAIVTAGTADLPVAEEAALYLMACGVTTKRINDVGIAGLHRLLDVLPILRECSVCIVIAGMDGVLPTAVAGLIENPVIAVPTSVGYGASFEGLSALLTMLNSCAAGLTVVNIDNGFGAAAAALRILSAITITNATSVNYEQLV